MKEKEERKKNSKIDLEETIKDKVTPLLEETMEKHWGITIPKIETDLTDKLANPQLNIYLSSNLNFSDAKKVFKKEFLKRELRLHQGNVSYLAKLLNLDRRSIHRAIKRLGIDIEDAREHNESIVDYQQGMIDQAIRSTLDQYKNIIQPQKMEKMYREVETLSKNLAKIIPAPELTWKEAEREFEKQFLSNALKENQNKINATAQKIKIRAETLHRKIKKLGLR